jgi:hypothetical protein
MIGHVHEAVLDQRRSFERFVGGGAPQRDGKAQLEVLDIGLVDRRQRRMALGAEIAVIHQPVMRLAIGLEQALVRYIGGAQAGRRYAHSKAAERR